MEFFAEYIGFLAKTVTLVIAIVVVLVTIAALRSKGRQGTGQLQVNKLNDFFKQLHQRMEHAVLDKEQLKAASKAEAKA
ncbi:MAG: protease SohB, partial [Pseudomonadales bacterium]